MPGACACLLFRCALKFENRREAGYILRQNTIPKFTWTYSENKPTAWNRVLFKKLTVTQLLKKYPAFGIIEGNRDTFQP